MLEEAASAIRKKGYKTKTFRDRLEAAEYLLEQLHDTTVGIGGSDTIRQMDIYEPLCRTNQVYWHWEGGAEMRRLAMTTESYLTSVNALAVTGEMVNIDYTGNRTASVFYGHKRVFFVVGRNKLTASLAEAVDRARNVAAPKNAQRLQRNTPCAARADRCYDCDSPDRICRGLQILLRPMAGVEMQVLLIDEDLGF